ncbi:MAG: tail fiber domain-containing protein [Candidatus Udaeobacter sp.]
MKRNIRSVLMIVALSCVAADAPKTHAVVPAPDGGYPNFTTAEGTNALKNLTTGAGNTAVGWQSLFTDTSGGFNTAVGAGTLLFNNADSNTAVGTAALLLNTAGVQNTAIGTTTLLNNTIGYSNTAIGADALFSNTEGRLNTAVGESALLNNNTGQLNTAIAANALSRNTSGENNTAVGYAALLGNTTGDTNTAVGSFALNSNDTGIGNSAVGANALAINSAGEFNTAIGYEALSQNTGTLNTAVGWRAGINNTGGSVNIYIGNEGGGPIESNVMRLGRSGDAPTLSTYIAGIFGRNVSGAAVYIDSDGQLGTVNSSRRFKHDIKPMDKASEAILSFKPVTFHYSSDMKSSPQFGLIAEEVAEVNPNLVIHDKNGDLLSVRYDQVNAMLLNEFLKEHRRVEKLEAALNAITTRLEQQQEVSVAVGVGQAASHLASSDLPENGRKESEIPRLRSE